MSKDLIIIGGGAAGYFAAINAKLQNPALDITILEASQTPLKKVKISGGGRCNLTHHCFDPRQLAQGYPRGARELRSAFSRFQPRDTIAWFKTHGVETTHETDGRVFPITNTSATIIDCFERLRQHLGIRLEKGARVTAINQTAAGFDCQLKTGQLLKSRRLMMTTGSDPKALALTTALGHTPTRCLPSLFTFKAKGDAFAHLAGQSVPYAEVELLVAKKRFHRSGPVLITHWGFSGPAMLKLSAFAAPELYDSDYQAALTINWLADHCEVVIAKLKELKALAPDKKLTTTPLGSLSKRLWQYLLLKADLPDTLWQHISHKQLRKLAEVLSRDHYYVNGKGVFKEEFVTCGGVDLKEIDFRTMQSKNTPGLYFAGEILNIDGITGGFNFQNAWTTSWIAAQAIACESQENIES